ncbi:MAG: 16S rRNA (adenine(1518)-N(6)/adenine(1519)-N(6)) -dimethyltransferase RsmA [Chlamydiales bacterium]
MIYRPKDLQDFLRREGISPKKGLSQNFLIDQNVIKKMIDILHLEPGDTVLEIGPGPGAFTDFLAKIPHINILAIEKDLTLTHLLEEKYRNHPRVRIVNSDILACELSTLIPADQKVKVISNLPFSITAPALAKCLPLQDQIHSMTLILQDEVAKRICANPGSKQMSSLTLFVQFYSEVHYICSVSRRSFFPVPKVEAAIIHFKLRPPPQMINAENFFSFVRKGYQQRRKMLSSSIGKFYGGSGKVKEILSKCGISPQARPEDLSLTQFMQFFERAQIEE